MRKTMKTAKRYARYVRYVTTSLATVAFGRDLN